MSDDIANTYKYAEDWARSASISCDWPVCIGGECDYECERLDRHKCGGRLETASRDEVDCKMAATKQNGGLLADQCAWPECGCPRTKPEEGDGPNG